ncbi:glycosyltransferase family 2 protein [Brevibacillus sp. NRS-1366]|uniref:glycosyltransferase family 2 protein n=1 Tax=Brevibacillus sp. NRS-1366 TaxID=3233899 RepID=UPI003D25937B
MVHQSFPLVSVITPSYNQGKYIRETIESVLNQDYPNIEYIVVDGGSTDDTLAILEEYSQFEERIRFISEKDRGQSHAINKGLAMTKGEIIGWLNSDDTYLPGAIQQAVNALQGHPDWAMVYGKGYTIDENSKKQSDYYVAPANYQLLFDGCMICQPAVFIRKNVFLEVEGVDEMLHFCMDYDLWIRIAKKHTIGFIQAALANARAHSTCKTSTLWSTVGIPEVLRTSVKHYGTISKTWLLAYQNQHGDKGITGLLHFLRNQSAFDCLPMVTSMNRYDDLWVPPRFTFSVETDACCPVHSLIIKGKIPSASAPHLPEHYKFRCSVQVDGQPAGNYIVGSTFLLNIPVPSKQEKFEVDILSSFFLTSVDKRMVSFVADEVIPLSIEESKVFNSISNSSVLLKIG